DLAVGSLPGSPTAIQNADFLDPPVTDDIPDAGSVPQIVAIHNHAGIDVNPHVGQSILPELLVWISGKILAPSRGVDRAGQRQVACLISVKGPDINDSELFSGCWLGQFRCFNE